MINLPMIEYVYFFGIMFALQAFDAFSTAKALRNGASEANGILKKLMAMIGVNETLFIAKLVYLVYLWNTPVTASGQWLSIAIYTAVGINNARVLRKLST